MKFKIFAILCLVLSLTGSAQKSKRKVAISWTNNTKKNTNDITTIISYDENGYFAVKEEQRRPKLVYYNKNMLPLKKVDLNLKGRFLDFVFFENNNLLVFSSAIDFASGRRMLYLNKYDSQTFRYKEAKFLFTVECESGKQAVEPFIYRKSQDREKMVVVHRASGIDKQKLNAFVLNKKYEVEWKNKMEFNHKKDVFELSELEIDDLGNVYLLNTIFEENKPKLFKSKINKSYEIKVINSNGVYSSTFLSHTDKFINSLKIFPENGKKVKCFGLYSEKT